QATVIVELPRAVKFDFPQVNLWQGTKVIRNAAVVRTRGFDHIEAHDPEGLRIPIDEPARRASAVGLFEPIQEIDLVSHFVLGKIDNHVDALRHAQVDAVGEEWLRLKVAIASDDDERFARTQGQLIESRRPAVDQAQAVLASFDLEIRLNLPIDGVLITQDAVCVKDIEDHLPG